MSARAERAQRRRAEIHRLAADGLGVREIARRLGCDPSTVSRQLRVPRPGSPVPGHASKGDQRALKGGWESQTMLGPLRESHAKALRRDYPHLDDRRLAVLTDRLARIESASNWLDRQGGVVRNLDGDVYAVVDRIEQWSNRVEKVLAELEAEPREARHDLLAEIVAEDEGAEPNG